MGGGKKDAIPATTGQENAGGTFPGAVGGPTVTFPSHLPGQRTAISNQLAAGFGGDPAAYMAQAKTYFQPMVMPNYGVLSSAAKPKATTSTAKKATAKPKATGVLSPTSTGSDFIQYLSETR